MLSTVLLPTLLLFLLSTPPSPASSAPASAAPRQMSIRSFFKPAGSGAALPDAGVEDGAPAAKRTRLSEPPAADGTAPADAVGSPAGSRSQHETPAKGEGQGKGNSTLTQEQLERIERNRALALERKAKNASAAVAPGGGVSTVMDAALAMPEKWRARLQGEFGQPYFKKLCEFHTAEVLKKKTIFPPTAEVFSAFYACDFDKISVVIVGQDPYHGKRSNPPNAP